MPSAPIAARPAAVGECWSCGAANLPSRAFCADCGAWTRATPLGEAPPKVAPSPAPVSKGTTPASTDAVPVAGATIPTSPQAEAIAGTTALSSYSVALRHRSGSGHRRVLAGSAALMLIAALGLAAVYGAIVPGGRGDQPAPAAALAMTETAAATSIPVTPEPVTPEPATPDPATAEPPTPAAATPRPVTTREPATPEPQLAASSITNNTRADKPAPRQAGKTISPSGWVCDGQIRLEDPRGRRWSLGRAAFRAGPGYERVVLQIKRLGPGKGEPASVTAEAMSSAQVRGSIPGVRRPSVGQTTVSLLLAGGIDGNLGVRGYRPSGLAMLKEFSVYPAGGGASRVLVSTSGGECFRVRVPAWTATGPNTPAAQIYLDIKR